MRQWLDNKYPFALVGSEGCGKSMLIKEAFTVHIAERGKQNKNVNIASIHCNGYTKASHVISKLSQSCSSFHSNNGKVLRPNGCDTLILYLKDINLSKPDNYNTSQIVELLQQFITYKGFYDANLDFVHLEHIQFVFSMNHIDTFGTHALSNRFTARIGMISIEEATKEELNIIYSNYAGIISSVSQLNATQTKLLQTASSAMIDIYYEIKTTFRRDEHRHFILTLRDLTQWIFGLMRYSLNSVGIIRVWYNECIRLFYDRMPNTNTKQKLQNILTSVTNKYKLQFTAPKETTLYCTFVSDVDSENDDIKQPDEHQKCIKQMGLPFTSISLHDFQSVIAAKIRLYEKEYNELHLILFEEFLQHLQKIDRIITHGYFHNMLLIGNSGIGRKIIVKLLCYIHRIECKILKVSQEYCGKNQFANTLKNILKSTGVDGKKVLLYIEDCQLIDNVMLQYLNELVSTGDVIGLFEDKELDNVLTPIKEEYKQNGINQYKSIYDYFISRVVAHLYIVLSVDPKNKTFVSICETNPSLITNCNVIWMGNQWRNESMIKYAHSQLQPILNHCADEKESKELLQQIQSLHCENIEYGACPRTFMVLVSVYNSIFKQKLSHNQHLKGHLMSGLRKLNEAKQIVDELSIKAKQQRELLKEKQSEADVALDKITKSMTLANARRTQAEEIKISLAEKEVILNGRKQKVEIELADIQPMVDEAKAAVCGIRKDSLNELRMLRLPPESINDVLSGVLILMGNFDTSWQSMKSFLSKPSVKQEIINYNARRITPQILKKANKLLNDPKRKHSFDPKRIQRVSVAAAPLAAWFKANISYSLVLQKIAPLERELDTAQFDINDAQQNMNKVESELIELDQQVASLKVNFTKITSEAEVLKISLKNVEETLERSQTLFDKLSDEKHRWDEQVDEINKITVLLPKYCLIAANFVTYLGGYPENIRVKCMDKWSEMCDVCDDDLSVLRFMNNESDLLKWKSEGLPDDKLSYENAMILLNCVLFPFIIDPNGDATTWLTNYLNVENISYEIIQQSDARFMKQLELSVRFGKTIIVTDVDDIHPSLYPLLRKNITKQGARQVISVGDKWIDYNEEFKLYLISRNMSFSLSSRCKPLVSCINFCVTWSGLESQLLAITMRSQQPELERKKSQLLGEEEKYKVQLAELEKELLRELAMSSGNILYNKSLIESLNNTKIQSENIKKALNESKIVQNDLNKQREIYRVLAVIGSNAYFTIKSLQSLNNMYQFSLFTFLSLFASNLKSICHSSDHKNVAQHIANLEENLVSILYNYISRSLFKCDRLTFGLYFVHSLYGSKICKENEWEYFIGEIISCSNSKNIAIHTDIASISLPWIHIDIQQSFKDLCSNFEALILKCEFEKYTNKWSDWIQSNNPETDLTSFINNINFTDFEQLLLIQTFRADKLSNAINLFINKYIKGCNKNKIKSLKELYVSSKQSNDFLILFVTTTGADPSRELRELALNVVGGDHYFEMAMGCGQELKSEAINLIQSGAQKGYWICLKNLHLVIPWLKQELQAVILSLKKQKISSDFRLWLTTESHSNFASLLLQNSVTITCEPPPGVKQNLNRTLSIWSDEYMAGRNKNKFRTQLLFILAWFHAIIQERRTYVPCGWNKYYEFNESDLRASMEIIDSIFKKNKLNNICQIPWKLLCGLLNQAIYGGRIDNNIDLNTLNSYLNSYFNANTLSKVSKWKYLCHIPSSIQKYEYVNLINTMPSSDSPDMFALPLNANNIVSLQNIKQLFQSLKILSVSSLDDISYASISKLRQSQRKRIYPLIKLWKTIKTNENISSNNNVNDINPVINALSLEIEKVRILINYINKSMTDIEVGLFGNGSLSMRLQENICQLIAGIVPWDWNKLWNKGHGPSNPKIFLTLLINRKEILNTWMRENSLGKLSKLNINIMIGELFYPITFLNAFKQYSAHKLQTTMDNLQFKCVWDRKLVHDITHIPILNIDGLYIQGALFDGKNIKPVSCKDSALSKVPVCYIYYHLIDDEKNNKNSNMQCIKIPTYYSLDRSYKVFDVDVIMNVDNINQAKWSLSGLAFIMTNVY